MGLGKYQPVIFSLAVGGFLLVGLLLLLNGVSQIARAAPGVLFVKPDGAGTACSQANPCDLQTALSQATDGDTIYVATGTYTGTGAAVVTVTQGITLYGGWDASFATRAPEQYPTVLDGERQHRVVYISGYITPTLDGFVITRGDATGLVTGCTGPAGNPSGCGGGLFVDDAHPIISNNVITDNVASTANTDTGYGGGIYLHNADRAVISGNLIVSNTACVSCYGNGGGIGGAYADGITVYGNRVLSNVAVVSGSGTGWGGGIALSYGGGTVEQNEMADNWATQGTGAGYGGGIYQWKGTYAIRNNRVTGNHGDHAVYLEYSASTFEANEVVDNAATDAVQLRYGGTDAPRLINNVIAGSQNGVYAGAMSGYPLTAHLIHNTLVGLGGTTGYGVWVGSYTTLYLTNTMVVSFPTGTSGNVIPDHTLFWANGSDGVVGTNPVYGDPAFLAPDGGNYHIRADSAARNAGVDAAVTTDIDGDPRPVGAGYDIGADEYITRVYLPLVLKSYP